jgi:methyl-accepting chemotaxis protein
MDEIVGSVKRVTDIMAEITAASQEQSSGIEQVNQAITQMDQVTQQNAALVEEAAAAAQSMQEQAAELLHGVSVFKPDTPQADLRMATIRQQAAPMQPPRCMGQLPLRGTGKLLRTIEHRTTCACDSPSATGASMRRGLR